MVHKFRQQRPADASGAVRVSSATILKKINGDVIDQPEKKISCANLHWPDSPGWSSPYASYLPLSALPVLPCKTRSYQVKLHKFLKIALCHFTLENLGYNSARATGHVAHSPVSWPHFDYREMWVTSCRHKKCASMVLNVFAKYNVGSFW